MFGNQINVLKNILSNVEIVLATFSVRKYIWPGFFFFNVVIGLESDEF